MKIGFFVTFFVVTVKAFETSGDGTSGDGSNDDEETVVNNVINVNNVVNIVIDPGTSSDANIVIDLCAGKCDSFPNTECMIVKSNSIGYVCPCIAGFALNNAGQCIEETVPGNTVTDTTEKTETTTQEISKTTTSTTMQTDVTFPRGKNDPEKSTPNSGSILASVTSILMGALFL